MRGSNPNAFSETLASSSAFCCGARALLPGGRAAGGVGGLPAEGVTARREGLRPEARVAAPLRVRRHAAWLPTPVRAGNADRLGTATFTWKSLCPQH